MRYRLSSLQKLDQVLAERLAANGVTHTTDLLDMAGAATKRDQLLKKLDLQEATILRLIRLADLLRVKGVGPGLAYLLIELGEVDSVAGLAMSDPVEVTKRLRERNEELCILRKAPSLYRIKNVVTSASMLKPLIIEREGCVPEFRSELERQKSGRQFRRFALVLALAVVLFEGVMLALFSLEVEQRIPDVSDDYILLVAELMRSFRNHLVIGLAIFGGLLLSSTLGLLFSLEAFHKNLLWGRIVLSLFDNNNHQRRFVRFLRTESSAMKRIRKPLYLFLLVFYASFLGYLVSLENVSMADTKLVLWAAGVGMGIVILVITYYNLQAALTFYRRVPKPGLGGAVKRFLFFRFLTLSIFPFGFLLLLQGALPIAVATHRFLAREIIVPSVRQEGSLILERLASLDLEDLEKIGRREEAIARWKEEILPALQRVLEAKDEEGQPYEEFVLRQLSGLAAFLLIMIIVSYGIVPAILLYGWRKAMVLFLVSVISYVTSLLGSRYLPLYIGVSGTSSGAFMTLFAVIFVLLMFLQDTAQGAFRDSEE